nr:hypothetical protein [Demequina rhizosphaerae]
MSSSSSRPRWGSAIPRTTTRGADHERLGPGPADGVDRADLGRPRWLDHRARAQAGERSHALGRRGHARPRLNSATTSSRPGARPPPSRCR